MSETVKRELVWHVIDGDDVEWPKYGMGHYLVINNVGRMFLATEFLSHFPQGMVFYIPKRDRPYIGVDRVKAWAEVPPLKALS